MRACFLMDSALLSDKTVKLIPWNRSGEEVTLCKVTSEIFQRQELLFGFHTFRNDRHPQDFCNIQDQLNNPRIVFFPSKSGADEAHVQLQRVNRETVQHAQ